MLNFLYDTETILSDLLADLLVYHHPTMMGCWNLSDEEISYPMDKHEDRFGADRGVGLNRDQLADTVSIMATTSV